jgi:hypothetical protein
MGQGEQRMRRACQWVVWRRTCYDGGKPILDAGFATEEAFIVLFPLLQQVIADSAIILNAMDTSLRRSTRTNEQD